MVVRHPAACREGRWRSRGEHRRGRAQRGLSMVELALAVAILGVVALVVGRHGANVATRQSAAQSRVSIDRTEAALRAHAFVHARLPCPAADAQGREACDGRVDGFLPYRTLGLPDVSAGRMRYRLDSARLSDAGVVPFPVLAPVARAGGGGGEAGGLANGRVPLHDASAPGGDRMLELCTTLGAPGTDVAFSLSLASTAGPSTAAKPNGDAQQARMRPVRRSLLWSDLSCAALVSTAGRAQFNARLQAAVMRQAIGDYRRQSDVALGLSEWDFAQSHWFLVNSAYSATKTGIKLHIARSAWLASLRADPEPATAMGLAAAALATSVLHMAVNASTLARGAANLSAARANRDVLDGLAARAASLEAEIARHAAIGGSNFVFLTQRQAGADVFAPAAAPAAPKAGTSEEALSREAKRYRDAIGRS